MPCLKNPHDQTAGFPNRIPVLPLSLVGKARMPCFNKRRDQTAGFRILIPVAATRHCWHGTNAMLEKKDEITLQDSVTKFRFLPPFPCWHGTRAMLGKTA